MTGASQFKDYGILSFEKSSWQETAKAMYVIFCRWQVLAPREIFNTITIDAIQQKRWFESF